jgi:hypothetical protein
MKDKLLIWILSLFIGLFFTLIFIIYNNYFIKTKNNIEQFNTDSDITNLPLISQDEWAETLTERQKYNKILEKTFEYINQKEQIEKKHKQTFGINDPIPASDCPHTKIRSSTDNTIPASYTLNEKIPLKENILMTINNFNYIDDVNKNIKNIDNNVLRWFDYIKYENPDFDITDQNNNLLYFTFLTPIQYVDYYGKLTNIKVPELTGPLQNKFTNTPTPNSPVNIQSFSLVFFIIINSIEYNKENLLFKLPIRNDTESTNILLKLENPSQDTTNCKRNIIIKCGENNNFRLDNINNNLLEKKNIMICLSYDKTANKFKLTLDKLYKEFNTSQNLSNYKYTDSNFSINSGSNLDMQLYSFTYYNTYLNNVDLEIINNYNNYYINKLNNIDREKIDNMDRFEQCKLENDSIKETLEYTLIQKEKEVEEYKKKYQDLLNHPHTHMHSTY